MTHGGGSERQGEIIAFAKQVIDAEIAGMAAVRDRLGAEFEKALQLVMECQGKVIFTGIGKSGHIGRKLSATFASTGTPAFFVHADEALHGDSGMVEARDLVFAISNSGETAELLAFVQIIKKIGAPIIAMTAGLDSTLAKAAVVTLDISVPKEADPYDIVPSASVAATLALGDALAIAAMKLRGFGKDDFAVFHPGGALGAMLLGNG
ncbi:MAG TPA: SIS domain-containing protein [Limnochordia bacterium]|nr:SIS domain-containing protein [Limnochordia bacterium]